MFVLYQRVQHKSTFSEQCISQDFWKRAENFPTLDFQYLNQSKTTILSQQVSKGTHVSPMTRGSKKRQPDFLKKLPQISLQDKEKKISNHSSYLNQLVKIDACHYSVKTA